MEISGEQKIKTYGDKHIGDSFVPQTPMHIGRDAEIPEKYLVLSELFSRMVCSIRLLSLRKWCTTFHNIQIQVESLTGRNFQFRNLSQMKYILPEALKIEEVRVHDEEGLCSKPEMNIMLVHDIVEGHCEESDYVALTELFVTRVRNFHRKNPEASDIPEADLYELFKRKHTTTIETTQEHLYDLPYSYNVIKLNNAIRQANIPPSPCFETDVTNSGKRKHCTSDISTSEIKKGTHLKFATECYQIASKRSLMFCQDDLTEHHPSATYCIPEIVPVISQFFKSVGCPVTKEERIQKKLVTYCDTDEKGDVVERQLELLENLVPDFICKKSTPSGDYLHSCGISLSINEISDLGSILETVSISNLNGGHP